MSYQARFSFLVTSVRSSGPAGGRIIIPIVMCAEISYMSSKHCLSISDIELSNEMMDSQNEPAVFTKTVEETQAL